jgi:ankyrin repeat protein
MQLKRMALGKFQHWIEGADADALEEVPMHVVRRRLLAELHRRVQAGHGRKEERSGAREASFGDHVRSHALVWGARAAARVLCKELGLVVKSVDEITEGGEPPLVAAGSGGSVWALELLLAAGCAVGSSSKDSSTALHAASVLGHMGSVVCLVEAGADVHAKTGAGETCLNLAAGAGQSKVVKYLAEKGGLKLVLAVDSEGRSCAYMASAKGHLEALRMLIDAGGKQLLMLTDCNSTSCAWMASQNGHAEAMRMLIDAGGKDLLMLARNNGWSCADIASQNGHTEALRMLVEAGVEASE